MERLLLQSAIAFGIGICYGVVFSVPRRALFAGGIAGALGWLGYLVVSDSTGSAIAGSLVGGVLVAIVAEVSARVQKYPVSVVAVPGIVLLVPGFMAYNMMNAILRGNYQLGVAYGMQTLFLAGAITVGIVLTGGWLSITKQRLKKGFDDREGAGDHRKV